MAGFLRGECMGCSLGDEALNLTRCHNCGLPQLYEAFEGWKPVCGRAYNLKGIKGKFSIFLHFLKLCFSFTSSFLGMMRDDHAVAGGGDSIINLFSLGCSRTGSLPISYASLTCTWG